VNCELSYDGGLFSLFWNWKRAMFAGKRPRNPQSFLSRIPVIEIAQCKDGARYFDMPELFLGEEAIVCAESLTTEKNGLKCRVKIRGPRAGYSAYEIMCRGGFASLFSDWHDLVFKQSNRKT